MSAPLYHLIASCPEADRRVLTPRGPGLLWQVFRGRVGVVLDGQAAGKDGKAKVCFFGPGEVTVVEKTT